MSISIFNRPSFERTPPKLIAISLILCLAMPSLYASEQVQMVHPSKFRGYIDKSGKPFLPMTAKWFLNFHEGLAAAEGPNGLCGYINKKGEFVIKPAFSKGGDFSEGLAPVLSNGLWGFVDKNGKIAIKPQFKEVNGFSEGLATVTRLRRDPQSGEPHYIDAFIDRSGKVCLLPPKDSRPASFREGLCRTFVWPDSSEYIDSRGNRKLKIDNAAASSFSSRLTVVPQDGKIKYILPNGLVYKEVDGTEATQAKEGLSLVYSKPKTSMFLTLIDGGFVRELKNIDYATPFSEGLALVGHDGDSPTLEKDPSDNTIRFYIDKTGKRLSNRNYNSALPFSEGLAAVNFKTGYSYEGSEVRFPEKDLISDVHILDPR